MSLKCLEPKPRSKRFGGAGQHALLALSLPRIGSRRTLRTFRDQSVGTTDCPHHEDKRKCCGKCCDGEISVHSYPLVKLCALNALEKVLVPLAGEGEIRFSKYACLQPY